MQDVRWRLGEGVGKAGRLFERYVFLDGGELTGHIYRILDGDCRMIYGAD